MCSTLRRSRQLACCLSLIVLCALTAPTRLSAQGSSTATVTGTVIDQKGATVPGANVELRSLTTNDSRTQTTNDAGLFTFASVPPGGYKVTVTKDGFRTMAIGPLDVQVGKSLGLDVKLEIGTVSQTIEVQAGAAVELQTLDAAVGNVLERKMLENLPSMSRDATAL